MGTALGGPIGGAIGGLLGNSIDHAVLFRPRGRSGGRLADLQVQTSSYGTQMPKLFGRMRVAGTVIWATDLKETKNRTGGGKGRPSVTTYDYSASFAVALSARRIGRVLRIWADGNLLRGAAGDFKTEVSAFRVHQGGEDQAVDPLIASAEGIGRTPAHRGIAYAVFEDLALADFGNRIPSLTFEVEADTGAVEIGTIAEAVSGGCIGGIGLGRVDGYAASGADVGEALMPLVESHGLALDGHRLLAPGDPDARIDSEGMVRRVNGRPIDSMERAGGGADTVPLALSIRHHDAARDYQAGVQRVTRAGAGRGEAGFDLPAVLTSDAARALAASRLATAWTGRATMTVRCGWAALPIRPGRVVEVADVAGLWRVEEQEWEAMAVRLRLRRLPGGGALPNGASSGTIIRQEDAPHGVTTLMLADIPWLKEGAALTPSIVAAASGGTGWRRAALVVMNDAGEAISGGRTGARATMGVVPAPIPSGSIMLVDDRHAFDVALLADDMNLLSVNEAALSEGRNLCLVGRELIQFARARKIDARHYRLSGLRRGLNGTDWAMAIHEPGEEFLLIEEDRLVDPLAVSGVRAEPGRSVEIAALGLGDVAPVVARLTTSGEALIPPSPVHVRTSPDGAGGVHIRWVRRSRGGWRWTNGSDVPLGEEAERYRIDLWTREVLIRSITVASPHWHYDAAMAAADGAASTRRIEIRQLGTYAEGRAATAILTL